MSSLPAIGSRLSANPVPVASMTGGATRTAPRDWHLAKQLAAQDGAASLVYERAVFVRFCRIVAGASLRRLVARYLPPHTAEVLYCEAYTEVSRAWRTKRFRFDRPATLSRDRCIALRAACDLAWVGWAKSLGQPIEVVIAKANQAREIAESAEAARRTA